jgi:hypothetical protein
MDRKSGRLIKMQLGVQIVLEQSHLEQLMPIFAVSLGVKAPAYFMEAPTGLKLPARKAYKY